MSIKCSTLLRELQFKLFSFYLSSKNYALNTQKGNIYLKFGVFKSVVHI